MSYIDRFAAYAAAFETAYASDDWSAVKAFFTEDACYEIGLAALGAERCDGRDAILAWFPEVLDRFDRRFASRELALLDGPKETGNEVWFRGTATYSAEGVPDLVLELEETMRFEGDRIAYLADRYTPEMRATAEAYLQQHGETLGIALTPSPR